MDLEEVEKKNGCYYNMNVEKCLQRIVCFIKFFLGRDTLCVFPTSFGKSLIYQVLPKHQYDRPFVVVLSPLLSLIDDQVLAANNLTYLDLKACVLNVTEYEKLPLLAGVILTCFLGHLNKYRLNIG